MVDPVKYVNVSINHMYSGLWYSCDRSIIHPRFAIWYMVPLHFLKQACSTDISCSSISRSISLSSPWDMTVNINLLSWEIRTIVRLFEQILVSHFIGIVMYTDYFQRFVKLQVVHIFWQTVVIWIPYAKWEFLLLSIQPL